MLYSFRYIVSLQSKHCVHRDCIANAIENGIYKPIEIFCHERPNIEFRSKLKPFDGDTKTTKGTVKQSVPRGIQSRPSINEDESIENDENKSKISEPKTNPISEDSKQSINENSNATINEVRKPSLFGQVKGSAQQVSVIFILVTLVMYCFKSHWRTREVCKNCFDLK